MCSVPRGGEVNGRFWWVGVDFGFWGRLRFRVTRMRWCLENRDRLHEMGRAARATAERFTWEAYGERWKDIVKEVTDAICARQEHDSA